MPLKCFRHSPCEARAGTGTRLAVAVVLDVTSERVLPCCPVSLLDKGTRFGVDQLFSGGPVRQKGEALPLKDSQ